MRAPLSWLRDYAPLAAPAPELIGGEEGSGATIAKP